MWPRTKMRMEFLGQELSALENDQQSHNNHRSITNINNNNNNTPVAITTTTATATTTTSSLSPSSTPRALDASSNSSSNSISTPRTLGVSPNSSSSAMSTPRTLGVSQHGAWTDCPSTMSTRINSEFKKNMFFVSQDQPPITTDLAPEEVFEELDVLGHGSGGCVLRMRHKPTGKICAVKQMRRTLDDEENKRIYMDLQVVLQCECDNIVRCGGYFIKGSEVWICMELMTTCFDKLLKARQKPLPEKFLGAIAASSVKALYYLKEKHNIIHRDVKPSNILINDQGQIKLCDFGISGRLIDSVAKTRAVGCIPYMAPERVDYGHNSYDVRADVWSLGITLFELATGRSPYAECQTDFAILVKVVKDDPPSLPEDMDFSPEFRSFISACLTKDCKHRPKYATLIQHEFIKRHMDIVVNLSELD